MINQRASGNGAALAAAHTTTLNAYFAYSAFNTLLRQIFSFPIIYHGLLAALGTQALTGPRG